MAWIRTALAMIGFGFGVGKLNEALEKANPERVVDTLHSAQIVEKLLSPWAFSACSLLSSNIDKS